MRPHLGDNIEYVGEVSHNEKVELLQRAAVTVFPIQWPEPFGLVMVESMACGTPVLATRLGAVPEVVEHGRGGLVVDTIEEMAACMPRMLELDPLRHGRWRRRASRRSGWCSTTSAPTSASSPRRNKTATFLARQRSGA